MNKRPIIAGVFAADGLLAFFLVFVTSLSGWATAQTQFLHYWPYIVALAVGFGVQVGLFTYLRSAVQRASSKKVVAVTGTTSTAAMVSCCTHFLVNVLPILGATGIAAVVGQYQTELFWVSLSMNALGILYIGNRVRQFRQQHVAVTTSQVASAVPHPLITNRVVAIAFILVVVGVWGATRPAPVATSSAAPRVSAGSATRTSDENGMTVAVTPKRHGDGQWQFDVAIDNHSQGVTQDMVAVSSLADQRGAVYRPTAWTGDPPGGHHRSGVLSFPSLPADVTGFTLTLRDLGSVPERTFRWDSI